MNITPGICGQKTLLYFVYANMYFPFSPGFAWGVGVGTETHFDSMNKQFIQREERRGFIWEVQCLKPHSLSLRNILPKKLMDFIECSYAVYPKSQKKVCQPHILNLIVATIFSDARFIGNKRHGSCSYTSFFPQNRAMLQLYWHLSTRVHNNNMTTNSFLLLR